LALVLFLTRSIASVVFIAIFLARGAEVDGDFFVALGAVGLERGFEGVHVSIQMFFR